MAEIKFYANIKANNNNEDIGHTLGSGLGFYGAGWGVSVPVGSQQVSTWTTNSTGTAQGVQLHNTAMVDEGSDSAQGTVSIDSLNAVDLDELPNYLCPLNIRFTHDQPVKVQNCKLRIFDRTNTDNHAEDVITYVYEARHPGELGSHAQYSMRGRTSSTASKANTWFVYEPGVTDMVDMPFTASPGMSGYNTNSSDTNAANYGVSADNFLNEGVTHTSQRHDWYVALSSEPISVGSKTNYGLYFSVEYL